MVEDNVSSEKSKSERLETEMPTVYYLDRSLEF